MPFYSPAAKPRTRLALFQRSLVQDDATPFQSLLTDERIADVFAEEGISFGVDEDAVMARGRPVKGIRVGIALSEV